MSRTLKELFFSQPLAVLATQDHGQPYGSLVAFAATEDLKYILFATIRSTRKYSNLSKNPRVAMVIDNRTNKEIDFETAVAVTAVGTVRELEKDRFVDLYLSRHPHLRHFVTSPGCALLGMEVESYYIVRQFQNVTQFRME